MCRGFHPHPARYGQAEVARLAAELEEVSAGMDDAKASDVVVFGSTELRLCIDTSPAVLGAMVWYVTWHRVARGRVPPGMI